MWPGVRAAVRLYVPRIFCWFRTESRAVLEPILVPSLVQGNVLGLISARTPTASVQLSGESNLAAARAAAGAGTGPHTPRAGDRAAAPAAFAVHGAGASGRPGPGAPPPAAAAMARGTQAAVRDAYGYGSLELPFELKVLELCLDLVRGPGGPWCTGGQRNALSLSMRIRWCINAASQAVCGRCPAS